MEIESRCGWIESLRSKIKGKAVDVAKKTRQLAKDDPRRITHSIKVALALTLVSLFYYTRPLYNGFRESGIWAVLTVVVVFEFSVGATLSKGINRGLATFLAGALGVGAQQLASLLGEKGEPIVLGFLVFLLAAVSTFTRFFPHIKRRYDYGVLIFILTFSLVSVSGYRVEEIIELARQRLWTILVGGATCMITSVFVFPVWAGEDLQNLVAGNIEKLASFLEGFGGEYFEVCRDGENSAVVPNEDKSFLQGYKSVLNTKASEESLANFGWWEPGHGSFRFRHPWKLYLKVGAFARKCAYHIETLSPYISPESAPTPTEFRRKIQQPCLKMSSESGKALKELASAIKTVTHPSSAVIHIENAKKSVDDLKIALEGALMENADLLEIMPAVAVASILIDITKCVEKIAESVNELSHKARFKKAEEAGPPPPEKPQLLRRGTVKPVTDGDGDGDGDHVFIIVHGTSSESPENGILHAPKNCQNAVA